MIRYDRIEEFVLESWVCSA